MAEKVQRDEINSIEKQKVTCAGEAHLRHRQPAAAIFKLNVNCLNDIFDYLSLHDIQSIGQTCKLLQQAAGEYFQANHVTEAYANYGGIKYPGHNLQMDGFNEFAQNLLFTPLSIARTLKKKYLVCGPKLQSPAQTIEILRS